MHERVKVERIVQRARSTVLARVQRTVAAHRMLVPGARVLVAVSGGSDSVGLLSILAALQQTLSIDLVAAHVNHRLRGADSEADEQCAADAAARVGVRWVRADLAIDIRGSANLEARARELRYAALHQLATEADCTHIATGHTRDDQAETVLLRLIRGSGVGGLAGIEPTRADGVMRPLLDCTRAEIETFVRSAGHPYRIDASNRDERFLRARVRHTVLPLLRELNPAVVDNLVRVANLSGAERTIVQAWSAERLQEMCDGDQLDVGPVSALAPDLRRHVVRAWLLSVGVRAEGLTARHVDAVARLATSRSPSGAVRLHDGVITRRYQRLQLGADVRSEPFAACALRPGDAVVRAGGWRIDVDQVETSRAGSAVPRDLWSAVCDAAQLVDALVVRPARAGERVRPLGMAGGHRKLSDLFVDRKVPAAERAAYPVVSYGDEVLWVPGITRSELCCVGEGTTVILRLHATRG